VRLALKEFLRGRKGYLTAIAVLEKKNPRVSLEEMEKRLDLAD
jgi:hypothetical protein